MQVGDVLQFIPWGKINGQVWQNTMHYLVDELGSAPDEGEFQSILAEFALRYIQDVHTPAANMFSNTMTWEGIKGENLFNVSELGAHVFSPPLAGVDDGQPEPSFVSYVWTTPSGRRGMNSGRRYMPGVTELLKGDFGVLQNPAPLSGAAVAEFFSDTFTLSFGENFAKDVTLVPIILKRVRTGTGTAEDPYEYRLPRNVAERSYYKANAWTIKPTVTTMNSRKVGRGI